MTNPNNAIGVNAAYGTRTSVNAMNDLAQIVSGRGILSGWAVVPKSGMTVSVGGVAGTRDVAVGEDNLGNRICLNNRLASSVDVTIPAASVSSARYDAIVVYANNPTQAANTTPDAPSACGIIVASGSASGVSDSQIRSAITTDGGTGSTAYYAVLAQIYVGAGSTVITSANISQSYISVPIEDGSITEEKIDWSSIHTSGTGATITLPNSPNVAGWRVAWGGYMSATSSAGSVGISNLNGSIHVVRSCGGNGSVGTSYEVMGGEGFGILRGANTSFGGWCGINMTIMKTQMDDGARVILDCDTSFTSNSDGFASNIKGNWLLADANADINLTVNKGNSTFSAPGWFVETIYK
jgi:hypothetical protein